MPWTYPHSFRTYGKLRTPEPMAEAHREKILPRTLPYPSFENVLSLKILPGDIENLESTIVN